MTTHGTANARPTPPAMGPAASDTNPLKWLHSLLRGRYLWACLLAAVLGGTGAYLGHRSVTLAYQSVGAIRLKPYTAKVLWGTEETGMMPGFDTFLKAQVELMQSHRVTDMAMASEAWKSLGRGLTPQTQSRFRSSLNVWRASGSDIISVSFKDTNKAATKAAVTSVIESYQRLFNESEREKDTRRLKLLDEMRLNLTNRLNSVKTEIAGYGDAFGPEGVPYHYHTKAQIVRTLEQELRANALELKTLVRRIEEGPRPDELAETRVSTKQTTSPLQLRLESMRARLKMLKAGGYGPEYPPRIRLQQELAALESVVAAEQGAIEPSEATPTASPATVWRAARQREAEELRAKMEDQRGMLKQAEQELQVAAQEHGRLEELKAEAREAERKLDEVRRRIDQLSVESALGGRVDVLSYGDLRGEPVNAKQPVQMGLLGGVLGGGLGVGIVVLIGLANPRLRSSTDVGANTGKLRLLGVLPDLSDLKDVETSEHAGRCLHQIRMLLQLGEKGTAPQNLVITGPASGTGKTSLTLALGLSYAATGARTLVVDFDLVGGRLSRKLGGRRHRRLGALLRDEGLVTAEEIETAAQGLTNGHRLGEELIERRLVGPEDIDRIIAAQPESRAGVLDVLAGEPLEHCVVPMSAPNLSLLPIGDADPEHLSAVGRAALQRFLETARAEYDVVLVDTGPAPGSVETSLLAAEADRTVLVVSRGDDTRPFQECRKFLDAVGATIAGVVFNRATTMDMLRSPYSASQGSVTSRRSLPATSASGNGHERPHGFQKLASALASEQFEGLDGQAERRVASE